MTRFVFAAVLLFATPTVADVRLPKILNSHMVLQRDSQVKIWGWAEAGEIANVTGDWADAKAIIKADADGKWLVRIKTGQAGGPHSLSIAGKNTIKQRGF